MSKADIDFNTKYLDFPLGEKRCAYCGKVIEPDTEWDEYDRYDYYHCDCPDALKEIEIMKEVYRLEAECKINKNRLMDKLPKIKYKKEMQTVLVQIDGKK